MRSLSIGASGMLAQQTNVDVIANNIANMNTTAFKRQRPEFEDLLYEQVSRPGAVTSADGTRVPAGIQLGSGVRTAGVYRVLEQGPLSESKNKLDVAIEGQGYFRIALPNGEIAYTRAGTFKLSDQGEVVTTDGYRVQPDMAIPNGATEIAISPTGLVQVKMAEQTQLQDVGQLDLATFVNETGLEAIGANLFKETEASGQPTVSNPGQTGFGLLKQGYLESSNVNPVAEITALITAQRAYEMNSRIVKTADEMLATTTQLR
ncbi:flagellar basal-body rod protein FlgG [Sphingomonas sp. BK235]|uniref:flagellar basal-body rod protein FlgG n=1 Tax=Sphingomonas sp. BK235 TaxID=2512131 RepID=UPI001051AA78|nr:flagellar basal-body rod protein FlgG [Sphingomonas sp. BK235]TCP37517.1 flagellar basal-body rod protein FlgG [Sphingomonas sp. BK235]